MDRKIPKGKIMKPLILTLSLIGFIGCSSSEEVMYYKLEYHKSVLVSMKILMEKNSQIDSLITLLDDCKYAKEMRSMK